MKRLLVLALLIVPRSFGSLTWPTAADCEAAAQPDGGPDQVIEHGLDVPNQAPITAHFAITQKGNGWISLPGLSVQLYDSHDDGQVFHDFLLKSEWFISAHSVEFVVRGVADETTGRRRSIPVRGLFRLSAATHRFEVVSCSPEIPWRSSQ